MPTVFAAADLGSNTAHLLVASMGPTGIRRIANQSEWLSLGQIVSHEGLIPKGLVGQLGLCLTQFKAVASSMKANSLYVFATEAFRRADNHESVLKSLRRKTGVTIDLISPAREAELGLKGALLDCPMEGTFVFAESGGGSVQVAVCQGVDILQEASIPIGTGVLMDRHGLTQPPSQGQMEALTDDVAESLKILGDRGSGAPILASGGVARGLWRALHPDGESKLHRCELEHLLWATQRLDTRQIGARFSVKEKRAATLLPGTVIYLALMKMYKTDWMSVSQFGVREGAVLEMSQGKIVPCPL